MLYHCSPGSFSPAFFFFFAYFFLFMLNLIRNGASVGLKAIDLTENEIIGHPNLCTCINRN